MATAFFDPAKQVVPVVSSGSTPHLGLAGQSPLPIQGSPISAPMCFIPGLLLDHVTQGWKPSAVLLNHFMVSIDSLIALHTDSEIIGFLWLVSLLLAAFHEG
jgi:hypothetical protein